ncbi:MAG: TIGR04086 family membrane protein [Peptococcaceae bacterium]|jgi:putative membrane protein (TIGR04086 family)|nr:TIGR04086 family membrane protein [Peptococcaceae bacterium]
MSKSFRVSNILSGVFSAFVFALVLATVYGVLLSFTTLPERRLIINLIIILSVFGAGIFSAHRAGSKGLHHGLAVGAGFIVVSLLLLAILRDTPPSWLEILQRSGFSLIAGGVGGICGVFGQGQSNK